MQFVKTLIMLLPFALFACKQGEDAAQGLPLAGIVISGPRG